MGVWPDVFFPGLVPRGDLMDALQHPWEALSEADRETRLAFLQPVLETRRRLLCHALWVMDSPERQANARAQVIYDVPGATARTKGPPPLGGDVVAVPNYFQWLNLGLFPRPEDIAAAARQVALRWHPDKALGHAKQPALLGATLEPVAWRGQQDLLTARSQRLAGPPGPPAGAPPAGA